VDLIYLDPPFNSDRIHNVIFKSPAGERNAQTMAFDDTWSWGPQAEDEYAQLLVCPNTNVSETIRSFRQFLGDSDVMAYLVMMAIRLVELHRVLKPTGLLFLHCDPTASHYLKVITDRVFGGDRYVNEIVWRRTGAHNSTRSLGQIHDIIHVYSKTKKYSFNIVRRPYMRGHVEKRYREKVDGKRRFTSGGNVLTGAGRSEGDSGKPWRGFDPTAKDRHWAVPTHYYSLMPDTFQNLSTTEKLEALYEAGHIILEDGKAWPTMVRYLDERDGVPIQDIWAYQPYTEGTVWGTEDGVDADVVWFGPTDPRRLGYPTEKPPGLLNRIIQIGSKIGDVVLDPFCGCGWAIHVAQATGRHWVGIDISPRAIDLVERRLRKEFPNIKFSIRGLPTDFDGAKKLANSDKYAFQAWANALVDAQDYRGGKKGADDGIDGLRYFRDIENGKVVDRKVIVSVKGGANVTLDMIKTLQSTVSDYKAEVGLFVTLSRPTGPMVKQAVRGGFYTSHSGRKIPRTQILTIKELLPPHCKKPILPDPSALGDTTFKSPKSVAPTVEQTDIFVARGTKSN